MPKSVSFLANDKHRGCNNEALERERQSLEEGKAKEWAELNITKKKQTYRYREQTSGYQWGGGSREW